MPPSHAFCDPARLRGKSLRLHSVQGPPLLLVCDLNKSRTLSLQAPPLQKEEKSSCGMFVLSIVAGTPTYTLNTWHTQVLSKYLLSKRKRKGGKEENRLIFVRLVLNTALRMLGVILDTTMRWKWYLS